MNAPSRPTYAESTPANTGGPTAAMDAIHRVTRRRRDGGDGRTLDGGAWTVNLRRHGQRLARSFPDRRWGGRDAALDAARAWRDAVMAAVPPITNHHAATRVPARSTTGIAGVNRVVPADRPQDAMWLATLTTCEGFRRRAFTVSTHGEDGARAKAIAQRRTWLAELPPRQLAYCDASRSVAATQDPPATAPSLDPLPKLSTDEIARRLAQVNARIDATMPRRLRWSVRPQNRHRPKGALVLRISDAGSPARWKTKTLSPKRRAPDDLPAAILSKARDWLRATAADLHGPQTARWFHDTHLAEALDTERFDPIIGAGGDAIVPQKEKTSR